MTRESLTTHSGVHWQALQAQPSELPFEAIRRSRFALVAAERLYELPPDTHSVPVIASPFEASGHLMPHLVEMQTLSDAARVGLVESIERQAQQGEQSMIAAWLETQAEPAALQSHLRRAQACHSTGKQAWLRLHDPYVFIQLARVFDASTMQALFGPVERWHICLGGRWHSASPATATARRALPLNLHANQWRALLRISPVNRALLRLGHRKLTDIQMHSEHLDLLVQSAEAGHGIRQPAEQAEFAALACAVQTDFDQHPEARRALDQHHRDQTEAERSGRVLDSSAVDALKALPATAWHSIRTDFARRPLVNSNSNP